MKLSERPRLRVRKSVTVAGESRRRVPRQIRDIEHVVLSVQRHRCWPSQAVGEHRLRQFSLNDTQEESRATEAAGSTHPAGRGIRHHPRGRCVEHLRHRSSRPPEYTMRVGTASSDGPSRRLGTAGSRCSKIPRARSGGDGRAARLTAAHAETKGRMRACARCSRDRQASNASVPSRVGRLPIRGRGGTT